MAVNYSTDVKNDRLQVVADAVDAGTGNGALVIGTNELNGGSQGVLVSIELAKPCASIAGGVLTLSGLPKTGTASATGAPALAELRDSDGTVIAEGLTVGLAGSGPGGSDPDIVINALPITSGQAVQIASGTITHG